MLNKEKEVAGQCSNTEIDNDSVCLKISIKKFRSSSSRRGSTWSNDLSSSKKNICHYIYFFCLGTSLALVGGKQKNPMTFTPYLKASFILMLTLF